MRWRLRLGAALFRWRWWVLLVVFGLGFAVPWDRWVDLDAGQTTWLAAAGWLARAGWLGFSAATIAVLLVGIGCAVAAAVLRVWGTASRGAGLRAGSPKHGSPSTGLVNPDRGPVALSVGVMLHALSLAMIMPPSGSVFCVVATAALLLALPMRGADGAPSGGLPVPWWRAVLAEIYWVGVAGSFAVAGWRYNAFLLAKCVVVALGVSLVVRAAAMGREDVAR